MRYDLFSQSINVSRETHEALCAYVELILKWQPKINLISPNTVTQIWERHILDCAQLYPLIHSHGILLDIGSGAGLPGIVLSIMGKSNSVLVESDQRKAIFLKECIRQLNLDGSVLNQRAETIEKPARFITSRACAPLTKLFALSEPNIQPDTICIFPKGENCATEIEEAKNDWSFSYQTHPSITNAASVIIIASDIKKR